MGNCQDGSSVDNISNPSPNFSGLRIACFSWKNTYNNLFDYSADQSNYHKNFIQIDESCQIIKQNSDNFISTQLNKIEGNSLFSIVQKEKVKYVLSPSVNTSRLTANQLWLVLKSLPSKKYKLKEGDIVRIGKQKVKVKQIILDDKESTQQIIQIKSKYKVYETMTKEKSDGFNPPQQQQKLICRVCLDEGQFDNPLIAPCKCSGSAKYIHIKCIQQWFNKTINPRESNAAIIISWKPLVCELCHESLPFKIYLDGQKNFIVNIPRPKKPYLVLNPIDKSTGTTKLYFLVSFSNKKNLIIGRKKDSDIVMDLDSSISRHHTKIEYVEKQNKKSYFLVEDNESKFGTLVLLKKPVNLEQKHSGLSFQVGGSVLTLQHGGASKSKKVQMDEDDINASDSNSSEQEYEDEEEYKKEQVPNGGLNNEIDQYNVVTNVRPQKPQK